MSLDSQSLSQDEVFDLLSSPRRRYVLYYLRDTGEPIDLTSLAEEVAAWENETTVEDITQQERKRVYVSLYQTHVPRLAEAGLVEHDADTGKVALSEDANQIDQYLQSTDPTFSWQWVYLLLAGAGVALFGIATISGASSEMLSDSILIVAILAVFLVTAVIHTVSRLLRNRSIPNELRDRL